eukprot:5956721-Alexandrium_andersonii.AAC.2
MARRRHSPSHRAASCTAAPDDAGPATVVTGMAARWAYGSYAAGCCCEAVSYTHLTLPTICSV